MKKNFIFALGLLLVTGFSACSSEIEDGTTDIDSWPMPYIEVEGRYTYQHPCAMFNEADFTRVKTMLKTRKSTMWRQPTIFILPEVKGCVDLLESRCW